MAYLICYDITSNRKRAKVAGLLKRAGCVRIQKSVFVGDLYKNSLSSLQKDLQQLLQKRPAPNDNLFFLKVHRDAFLHLTQFGRNFDPRLVLGREKVLIL
ncbi:MAG: CRISPR-associated endonuclease Cas2 [Phaeodactylibacter sp.]|nr:CRISPR-associated endonuclease Cas2 [Phaeodactylibacter sp.]